MSKLEVLKELYVLVQQKNYREAFNLGNRCKTFDYRTVRSADIRAFFNDLFQPLEEEEKELLDMLEFSINDNLYG